MHALRMNRETEDSLSWFHRSLGRDAAEEVLKRNGSSDGIFLVRESASSPGDYVLSVLYKGDILHYQIRRHGEDAFFSIDDQTPIHGLDSLVEYYQDASHGLITKLSAMVKGQPPPPESRSHGRNNLLHRATQENHLVLVSELLQSGNRNFDAKNEKGQTAVHLICLIERKTADEKRISEQILEKLISVGSNVNCRDKDGNTPLHYACRCNSVVMIKALFDAKANIQSRNNDTGYVPLHDAADSGSFDALKTLLELDAPHLPRTTDGRTPLYIANVAGHTEIVAYLENYSPAVPTTSKDQWYHGTLDRDESKQILMDYAASLKEKLKSDSSSTDEADENISGVFLVRYSKRERKDVLAVLDTDVTKNFIIRKHNKLLYIDEGPYMLSLEHLVQHYTLFSDGLPTNLRYPVQPKPKPPLPLPLPQFSTMSKHEDHRTQFMRETVSSQFEINQNISSTPLKHPKRNFSVPCDDQMNQVGIASSLTNKTKSPGKSTDILNFRSLKLSANRKKNIIDGMKSLKLSKNSKNADKLKTNENENLSTNACINDEISRSFKNLTFSVDFKNSDILYNIPTNNGSIFAQESGSNSVTTSADQQSAHKNKDFFTRSDKQTKDFPDQFQNEPDDQEPSQEHDKLVEEIYFVDAPSKELPIPSSSFNYVAIQQIPYFPPTNNIDRSDVENNNDDSNPSDSWKEEPADQQNQNLSTSIPAIAESKPNYYIPRSCIQLKDVLGEGEFGSVYNGIMKTEIQDENGGFESIPVAVKTLHDEHCQENRVEFLREASVMIKLSHHCIVKLIGISKGPPLMIVQELVSLGSLLTFLVENSDKVKPNFELKIWAAQIACGMNYLESQHFVHRDLAARNILLSSIHQAKISDFGLSRALCANDNYYQATRGGKWPIKWYAPESFNYGTFSHASDVWSFGITLWEMYSFGQAPYGDMKGVDVIGIVEEGKRLTRPELCPEKVFHVICNCWNYSPKDRPTFRHLVDFFSNDPDYQNIIELVKTQNIC